MQVEIDELKPTKTRDIYKVHIENKIDYLKTKWVLSRIPINWAADDDTHTLYFLGKRMLD